MSEGLVIGKIDGVKLPREILVEPLGLGTPGAYVARVASRVLTSGELEKLKGLEDGCLGGNNRKSGTSKRDDGFSEDMAACEGDTAKYCVLKVLNTRRQYLELGKHIHLGQAEPLRWAPPVEAAFDLRNPGLEGTADLRVSSE
jgi:hypothetical protein